MTKREAIILFRKYLQERNADSTLPNKDLYMTLVSQANWLIKREVSAGRVYGNNYFFQTIRGMEVIEVPSIPDCIGLKTKCKIYRTKNQLPEMWQDNGGPIIKNVLSVDNSTSFMLISSGAWRNKIEDPYQRLSSEKYAIFSGGYIYFPQHNPNLTNVEAFFKDDIRLFDDECDGCKKERKCIKFLDTEFLVPDWITAELFAKSLQQLSPTKQLPDDLQIDKNTTRKS